MNDDSVREQYESLPYPARDPADEKRRLLTTWLDDLPMINHYGFAGRQSFRDGFRALVAGGGTGDGTIFLAQQLKDHGGEVVHLDISSASIGIAKRRAEIRGLSNISWVHDSLLRLPELGLGAFDYINCVGVLHHLEDPDAGLQALLGSLAEGGALGLMVYAPYGRAGVYQMQALMKLVNEDATDAASRIANTRWILGALPRSNWFKRGEDLYNDHRRGDAGLYDLFLHSRDRAYTVGELYSWLGDRHGLHLEFTDVQNGRSPYLPWMVAGPKPPKVVAQMRAWPLRRQHEIGELFCGRIQTHSFYATRTPSSAKYGDATLVPFFFHEPLTGPDAARIFAQARGQPMILSHAHTGIEVTVRPGRYGPDILRHIDGATTFGTIFGRVRAQHGKDEGGLSDASLFDDFRDIYETLNALERMLLKSST